MNNDIITQINDIRSHHASSNSKSVFSKKSKIDCAKMVLNAFDINTLLESTVVSIPDSHQLFVDYVIFKSFIIPELYDTMVSYTINKIVENVKKYGKIELHINLNTLSVSGYYRYKDCVFAYSTNLYSIIPNFSDVLVAIHLYNIPSCIDTIAHLIDPFIPPDTKKKMIKYDNISSEKAIRTILEIICITSSTNSQPSTPVDSVKKHASDNTQYLESYV